MPRNVRDAITGHTNSDMDARYDTVDNEDLLDGVDKLEAFYQEKTGDVTNLLPKQLSCNVSSGGVDGVSSCNPLMVPKAGFEPARA